MAEKDYYSFDEVLKDLRMEEDELKRLVSAGEIRAFRDQDTMRFKAADIHRLKSEPDDEAVDELDLDLELGDEFDLGDDLELDEAGLDEELVLEDDGAEGLEVEELDLMAEAEAQVAEDAGASPRRRAPRGQAQPDAEEEASEGAGMQALLILGFVVLVFANFAALGAMAGQTNALTGFLADIFG